MSAALDVFAHSFEGARVPGVMYRGQPCWPARATGRVAHGVDDGQQFIRNLLDSDEAEEGVEYFRVRGDDAQRILTAIDDDGKLPSSNSPRSRRGGARRELILFTESGLYAALMLGRSELSKRFRRWLTREVLPSIRRTGGWRRGPEVSGTVTETSVGLPLDSDEPAEAFERRAAHATAALDVALGHLVTRSDQDRAAVRETLRAGAATVAGVAGREWGQWTAAEHIAVLRALATIAASTAAASKRVAPMLVAPPRTRRRAASENPNQMTIFNRCTFIVGRAA